jgi:hypothetical protein
LTPAKTYNNLFDAHPPFQIDGNFGAVSGVNEMLLQSQNNELQFLPALPTVWSTGNIKGLRARKGFVVDEITWSGNKLTQATVTSLFGDTLRLRYGTITKTHLTKAGGKYVFDASLVLKSSTVTDIESAEEVRGIKVYPNPFSASGLYINKSGLFRYKITDMSGVVMEQGQGQNSQLVGAQLSSGVYLLSIENEGVESTHKIIRE